MLNYAPFSTSTSAYSTVWLFHHISAPTLNTSCRKHSPAAIIAPIVVVLFLAIVIFAIYVRRHRRHSKILKQDGVLPTEELDIEHIASIVTARLMPAPAQPETRERADGLAPHVNLDELIMRIAQQTYLPESSNRLSLATSQGLPPYRPPPSYRSEGPSGPTVAPVNPPNHRSKAGAKRG